MTNQSPRRPLSKRVRLILAAFALSNVGTGMVFPFTAIYLVKVLHVGAGAGGLFFGVIAAVSFALTPLSGRLIDAWEARKVCAAGACCQAVGYSLLASASSLPAVIGCAVLVGIGNSGFFPAFIPVLAVLQDPDQRKRVFSYRYLAMNLGLGAGALLAGHLIGAARSPGAFRVLYLLDGASFLPLAATVFFAGAHSAHVSGMAGQAAGRQYRTLLRHRPLSLLLGTQALLVLFAYSQLDSAVPVLFTERVSMPVSAVGVMIAVNTTAVVLLQVPLGRLLERGASSHVLTLCSAVWTVAAAFGGLATLVTPGWRFALLIVYAVAFACGETCYAVAYQPLLTEVTPPSMLGRGAALSTLAWNVGSMAGPSIGLLTVAAVPVAGLYWVVYGCGVAATAVLTRSLTRAIAARTPIAGEPDVAGAATRLRRRHG